MGDQSFGALAFARAMNVSRTQLYRRLNAITGQSVNEFIRALRLKRAVELLARGDRRITEVAFAVGFGNFSYFSRCFRRKFGVNPSNYARQG